MATVTKNALRVPAALIAASLLFVTACQQAAPSPAAPAPTAAPAKAAAPSPAAAVAAPTAAAAAATAAPAQAAAPAAQVAKPDVYKFGHTSALSGPSADGGVSFNNAAMLAVDQVNAKGGVDGVKLQMITEDHQADPKQALPAFSKLAKVDKVPFVISGYSSVIVGLSPTATELKTVLVNYAANTPTVRSIGPYTFSAIMLADVDLKALARWIYNEKKGRKLAIIYVNNDTGTVPAGVLRDTFKQLGGEVVAFEGQEANAADFGAQLAKVKAANPDVIHLQSLHQDASRMIKQLRQMGMQQQITSFSGLEAQQLFDVAGDAADGVIYSTVAPPVEGQAVQEFLGRYKAKYGNQPSGTQYALFVSDIITTILPETIKYLNKKGLPYTGENVRQGMLDVKSFDTPLGGKTVFQVPGQDVVKPVTLKIVDAKEKQFKTYKVIE